MLRRKALRKILITTATVFILMVVYFIPAKNQDTLKTNLEVEYIAGVGTNTIYLLNQDDLLVKAKIFLDSNDKLEQIKILLENLIIQNNNKLVNGLNGIIPLKTKIQEVKLEGKIVYIDFSKEFLNVEKGFEEKMIEAIVYSIFDLGDIEGIKLTVDQELLTNIPNTDKSLPEVLTRNIGINKVYDLDSRNSITKVTVYYVDALEGNNYYVPVTKYVNDERDKIKIIVDNLTSNYIYETNLMSLLSKDTKLIDYEIADDLMVLDFNNGIFNGGEKILEEVVYSICYSVFDNYDVDNILLKVNGKEIVKKSIKDLE